MAIIGTVPSQLYAKNQQLYEGSLICVCAEKYKIFTSKISLRELTFKITGHLN